MLHRVGLLLLPFCLTLLSCTSEEPSLQLTEQDIADTNRGVALMGSFDYTRARDQFQAVVDRQPQWLEAKVNLAIATLNRQDEGDEAVALNLLTEVIALDPTNLRAHYMTGMLLQNKGDIENAEQHFRLVVEADPEDAYASYHLGQTLKQLNRTDEAIALYQRAIELDPYLRSAYYGAALSLRQAGRSSEATAMLEGYTRFEHNPRARLAELKYTRMGPKGSVLAVDLQDTPSSSPAPPGPVFGDRVAALQLPSLDVRSSMTTVDIDGDGIQELFVTRVGPDEASALIGQANSQDGA